MIQKIKQIIYDMHHQPVVAWVTLIATALSVFLIMVVIIMQRVNVIPFAPESCRDRLMLGANMHVSSTDGDGEGSSHLSYETARLLYSGLDGVERISFMEHEPSGKDAQGSANELFRAQTRRVDDEFFNIFDHTLVGGRFFTPEESESAVAAAVISESTARRAFDSIHCVGQPITVDHKKYTVVGVVENTSPLARSGSGDIFLVTGPTDGDMNWGGDSWESVFGPFSVAILVKKGVDFQHVRDQVKARYAELDTRLAPYKRKTVYHEAPYDQQTIAAGISSTNITPDRDEGRKLRICLYSILLLVPAINLGCMLQSRMRRRISEIGLRRAFGCTRGRIISDILAENLIVTIAGGAAGFLLSLLFAGTYSGLYEDRGTDGLDLTPAFSTLVDWSILVPALAVCLILNLISAAVPAWRASRLNPVNAINAK